MKLDKLINSFAVMALAGSASASGEPRIIYDVESSAATYLQVNLEPDVYRYSRDSALRDLMVLDVEGKELPSRIVTLQPELTESSTSYPLSFFPVMAGEDPARWLSRRGAELRIDDDVVSLRLDPDRRVQSDLAEFYIIDITKLDQALDRLEVNWVGEELNQVVPVEVSASHDLQHWTRLTQQTLAQLDKEGEKLVRNTLRLALRPEQYPYLRLRFLSHTGVEVNSLRGHRIVQHLEGPAPQRWKVSGVLADDQRPVARRNTVAVSRRTDIAAWEFQRNDRAPVNRISVDLDDASYGERVRFYSRNSPAQPWQLQHTGVWFNVKVGDEWQQSEAIALHSNHDAFWRIEFSKGRDLPQPQMVFEYPQQRLQFIANNNPPYSLAINAEVPAQRSANQVFMRILDGREVSWQTLDKQLAEGAQSIEIRVGFNWQAALFWAALAMAVLVLATFAFRLLRQMDTTGN